MPNIKPVSDLRNYTEVLRATLKLLSELSKAEKTAEEKGWLSEEEADAAINSL